MFRKWNPKALFVDRSPLPFDLVQQRKERLHTKKQKKAKRRLINKRKRANDSVEIGGNLGRYSKHQRELY